MNKTIAIFTCLCLALGACSVDNFDNNIEENEQQEVINTNEIVDNGEASVHTFETDDMVYSMKLGKSDDGLIMVSYSIKIADENYESIIEYELVETDGEVILMAVDPDHAEANARELRTRLAGTDIEAHLSSGKVDLTAGIAQEDTVTFRGCGWLFSLMVAACAGTGVALALLTVGGAVAAIPLGGVCAAAHIKWAQCVGL